MPDRIETALREWLEKEDTVAKFDFIGNDWYVSDDDVPDLAAHLKAAGLVSVEDVAAVFEIVDHDVACMFETDECVAVHSALTRAMDGIRALTTPSDGGGE